MNINSWLETFKSNWKKGNVDQVLELFASDVDYYETPYRKLKNEELRQVWEGVKNQEDIELDLELYSSDEDKHTVKWHLSYREDGERTDLEGIYLIKLNSEGNCTEFWQYCQQE